MILVSMAKLFLIDMIFSYSPIIIISDPFLLSIFYLNGKNDTGLMEIIIDNDNEHDNDADIGNYWLLIK